MDTDITFLRQYPLFDRLSDDQLHAVLPLASPECFYPGHALFREGEPADKFYVLTEGRVEVLYTIGMEGPTQVDEMGKGDVIGCMALVPPYTYTSTANSLTKVEVLAVNGVGLRELSKQDCWLAMAVQGYIIQCLLDHIMDLRLRA